MGNAPSGPTLPNGLDLNHYGRNERRRAGGRTEASPSPTPGQPHHSLRHKKRSLELPDIQLNVRQPIPIPNASRSKPRRQQSGHTWSRQLSTVSIAQLTAPPPSVDDKSDFALSSHGEDDEEPYTQEIVRSTLPLPLVVIDAAPDPSNDVIETPIIWNGGGNLVYLARAGDDDWHSLIPMHRDGDRFIVKLRLTRGTHHLRFVVDNQSRVADDIPKAVDDKGAFANYVSVGLSSPPPTASTSPTTIARNHSFWSSSSEMHKRRMLSEEWTNVIPIELTEAAAEEDAFIASYNANSVTQGRRQVVTGFDVMPNPTLPPAPQLPRHLEKQILNTGNPPTVSSKEKRRGRHSSGHGHTHRRNSNTNLDRPRVLPVTTASGTDIHTFIEGMSLTVATPTSPNAKPSGIPVPYHDEEIIADDSSVLPVPSHVVLNHLSTSSIRNDVLAVADTVRYRNKFVTTIYYKPT